MVREALCYVIPYHMQCSMGCGGLACKYEDPSHWSEDDQAIRGIYSSWYTACTYICLLKHGLYQIRLSLWQSCEPKLLCMLRSPRTFFFMPKSYKNNEFPIDTSLVLHMLRCYVGKSRAYARAYGDEGCQSPPEWAGPSGYISRARHHRILRFLLLQRRRLRSPLIPEACSPLTRLAVRPSDLSAQLICRLFLTPSASQQLQLPLPPSGDILKEHLKEQIGVVSNAAPLLQCVQFSPAR